MIINLKCIPRAKKILLKKEAGTYKVYLTAPASDGKANALLIQVLAEHFKVKKNQIKIIRGAKSRQKAVQIDEP